MKLKAILFVALLTSTTAFAQFFPARVGVTVLPGLVTAQVVNPFFQPVVCSGQVFGQLSNGAVVNSFFFEQILGVGDYRYAYVNSAYLPFVNAWTNINCRYF